MFLATPALWYLETVQDPGSESTMPAILALLMEVKGNVCLLPGFLLMNLPVWSLLS